MEANWIRRGRSRLRNTKGFTLSETLMTVVLIGLVTMAMAGGIVAARNVYRRISLRADAQTLLGTTVSAITEDLSSVTSCDFGSFLQNSGTEIAPKADGTGAYYYARSRGYSMRYVNGTDKNNEKGIQVQSQSGVSIPLLPHKVQTRDLHAYIASISVTEPQSGDGGYFTLEIQIKKDDQVVEEATVCVHSQIK